MKTHVPSGRPLFSLLEDTVISNEENRLTVYSRWGAVEVVDRTDLVREALHRMSLGPVSLENIPELYDDFVSFKAGHGCGTQWLRLKQTLDALGGALVPSLGLQDGAGPILSLIAAHPDAQFHCPPIADNASIRMVPGTAIEDIDGDLVLVCAGLSYRVTLHRPPAAEIAKSLLDGETTIATMASDLLLDRGTVSDVVAYLGSAGFILTAEAEQNDGKPPGHR